MKEQVAKTAAGKTQLHNAMFYKIKPRGINCLAYNKSLHCLALCRMDGLIELWNMHHAPHLERIIPLSVNSQIEGLAWAGKRLFSVSLLGKLIEWNMDSLAILHEEAPTGKALWCLDINAAETEIAVGSEEGHINIMSIEYNEITYKSLFNRHEGRVLCCKFDKSGQRLVTGSVGSVRIWDVSKGTTLHKMSLFDKEVVVWSLQVLSNFTIIVGDSLGNVTLWNGHNGTHLETCKVLDKNVFALAVNEEENRLICSGMEPPLIRVLAKTEIKREEYVCNRWIRFLQRDVHKNFVKSLVVMDDRIISGGEDGLLCVSSGTRLHSTVAKYAPFLPNNCAALAHSSKLLLLRYPHHLEVWQLGSAKEQSKSELTVESNIGARQDLLLDKLPEKLLQLNLKDTQLVVAAAMSPNNQWICYSTVHETRLYHFSLGSITESCSLERLKQQLPPQLEKATHIIFQGSENLWLLHQDSCQLRCFNLKQNQITYAYAVDLKAHVQAYITHVEISKCGNYIVIVSLDNLVAVWQLIKGKKHEHILNLPRYKAATTALTMHHEKPLLVVAYADGRIMEYDLMKRCFTAESFELFIASSLTHSIKGILLDALNPNIIIVYNECDLYVLEKYNIGEAGEELSSGRKSKRLSKQVAETDSEVKTQTQGLRLKTQFKKEHLAQILRLGEKELVVVGLQPNNLLADIPPYLRKRFGIS